MDLLNKLNKAKLISPPNFLIDSTMFLARTGSVSYGVSSDTSDEDFVGFCIPPVNVIFPHINGEIHGWDMQTKRFEQWQQHGIKAFEKTYDFNVYNIVKWFRLTADCNPNMIDSLFVHRENIVHSTQISELVRENRKLFLSKKAKHTFSGYAYSQMNKAKVDKDPEIIDVRNFEREIGISHTTTYVAIQAEIDFRNNNTLPSLTGQLNCLTDLELERYRQLYSAGIKKTKRFESQKIHLVDVKFLYHLVRLMDEVEQILTLHDLDLHRAKEHLKAIRRGDVSYDEIMKFFSIKEKQLEDVYEKSTLPHSPNEKELKALLLKCIEIHYGSLDKYIVQTSKERDVLNQIAKLVSNY